MAKPSEPQGTIVKVYQGKEPEARRACRDDAVGMAAEGYSPMWQTYTAGRYPTIYWLGALGLCAFAVGIPLVIYMVLKPPPGTLSVTYEYRPPALPQAQEKICPKCAEAVKAAAQVCRFCGHSFGGVLVSDGA